MPDFWEFPTVSMGLGPLNAIYQARFNRYLQHRGIKDTSQQHVWAFLGDGEMDEPESLGAIGVAAREELDNLTFVINCNLQRLDGPVRGNGKVIQELEAFFRGAGWNVIKVVWGREWDPLLAADTDGALVNLMNTTPDGDYQTYKAESGAYVREHFFGRDPRTRKLVEHMSDDEIWNLKRGGHDYRKLYAAYQAAIEPHRAADGDPGQDHQGLDAGLALRGPQRHPPDEEADAGGPQDLPRPPLPRHPGLGAGGEPLPAAVLPPGREVRRDAVPAGAAASSSAVTCRRGGPRTIPLAIPPSEKFGDVKRGSGKQKVATTMAFVRLLKDLMKDKEIGKRWVPIIPDEARTFGMDSLFPTAKIYSPHGQRYTAVDRELFLSYKESTNGQILHEGINEAGSVASFIAAGTVVRHARRTDDPDVHLLLDVRVPAHRRRALGRGRPDDARLPARRDRRAHHAQRRRAPARGRALAPDRGDEPGRGRLRPGVRVRDRAHRRERPAPHVRREAGEHLLLPDRLQRADAPAGASRTGVDVQGLLKGIYRYAPAPSVDGKAPRANLLASGTGMQWALKAQQLLAEDWGVAADVWSVTSWTELRRDAIAVRGAQPAAPRRASAKVPYVQQQLADAQGPKIAVSDWMRAVPDLIARWVPGDYTSLGTDGFGLSDTRHALRRHFHVDAESIAVATLRQLALRGDGAARRAGARPPRSTPSTTCAPRRSARPAATPDPPRLRYRARRDGFAPGPPAFTPGSADGGEAGQAFQ